MENNTILKKQLLWTQICAAFTAALFLLLVIAAVIMAPRLARIYDTIDKLDGITDDLAEISSQLEKADWESIAGRLSEISRQLSEVNWVELSGNINEMAVDAQNSLDAALKAIDTLDIETLNQAISDLKTVIEPLARLVGTFG